MILSNTEIKKAIDEGRLGINPLPDLLSNTSSVDLHLGGSIQIPTPGAFNYDLRRGSIAAFLSVHSEAMTLDTRGFILDPNQFILGQTNERISLPISEGTQCLAARIEGRSSSARCGLLVHFTAPTVHSGFEGRLTLEMINLNAIPLTIYPGMPICQLIFEEVLGVPSESPSQFQGQVTPAGIPAKEPPPR